MTYQTVYSSESTTPMQSDDLQELLERARAANDRDGISGALVYTSGIFLQILEGERDAVQALMARIRNDVRHQNVIVLREGEIPSARFSSWKMAYIGATPAELARWAGIDAVTGKREAIGDTAENARRITQFAQDILALLAHEGPGGAAPSEDVGAGPGTT